MNERSELAKAAKSLLSEPPSELEQPPADSGAEVQDVQAQEQEAAPKAEAEKQETLEASDTEANPNLHKVKVDGQEVEVDYDELLKGYSRESHYQKKSKELSKERDDFTLKAKELEDSINDAQLVINDETAKLNSAEMRELREDDPEQYLREVERIENKVEKFQKLKEKQQAEAQQKEQARIAKEREMLFEMNPHWNDDEETMNKEVAEILGALESNGFSNEETRNITEARMFEIGKKLARLDKIESVDLESKKVTEKPASVKPNATGQNDVSESKSKKEVLYKTLRTGSLRDASKALTQT